MKFNNRPNECLILKNGREVWLSRSVAVSACIVVICRQSAYVLVNQRGPGLPDFVGRWNMPCGYLDYDESIAEAVYREVWEECGLNLEALMGAASIAFIERPWDISSAPRDERQTVGIHHGVLLELESLPDISNHYCEPDEVAEVRWLPLTEIHSLDYAFHHDQRILAFARHLHRTLGDTCPAEVKAVIGS